jgi:hypothetical protein
VEFKTSSNRSGLIGLAVAGGFLAGAIALVIALVSHLRAFQGQPVSPLTLGLMLALVVDLAALALLLYGSIAALRLHYQLDRNGLVICWRGSRLVIPMDRIQAIQPASQVGITDETVAFRGIAWAGLRVGQGRLSDDRLARMYATLPLDQSTVVSTPDGAYLL